MRTALFGTVALASILISAACISQHAHSSIPRGPGRDTPRVQAVPVNTSSANETSISPITEQIVVPMSQWPNAIEQLRATYGPNATIRINGTETAFLMPTAQIESVLVTRYPTGLVVIDIIATRR